MGPTVSWSTCAAACLPFFDMRECWSLCMPSAVKQGGTNPTTSLPEPRSKKLCSGIVSPALSALLSC